MKFATSMAKIGPAATTAAGQKQQNKKNNYTRKESRGWCRCLKCS